MATTSLNAGNYVAYAIDSSGNISEASRLITLQTTVFSPFFPDIPEIKIQYISSSDIINITSKNPLSRIFVYNLYGKNILNINCSGNEFDFKTSGFPSGIYFVRVSDTKDKLKTQKIFLK
jgi:hypothetical protein